MEDGYPAVGELVIGTCSKVTNHGAYFEIFDYETLGSEVGFVHISELSRTWVRHIRSYIREGQRTVAKILRVDIDRGEIDMSIKQVSEPQRRQKLNEFKQENRARGIVAVACEKAGIPTEDVEKILFRKFGSIYDGLMSVRDKNANHLVKLDIPKEAAKEIYQLAVKELEPPTVQLTGHVNITCYEANGADLLAEFFTSYDKNFRKKHKGSKFNLQIISPPTYRCVIESIDWREAEKIWKDVQGEVSQFFSTYDTEISFERK
ncbi:MAG: S1 RNA-binding domain-containing protein [Candidatus Heimdallarchaeota archaeon]